MQRKIWLLALILAQAACRASETAQPRGPVPIAPDPAPRVSDLTLEQVIAKALAARGGEEKLRAVKAVKMTGTMTTREVSAGPTTLLVAPRRYLRRIVQGASGALINAVDGAAAWEVSPRNGIVKPTPMSAPDAARFRRLADPQGPLLDWQAKGNKVGLVGKLSWQGQEVYKLELTYADGGVNHLYLDAQSFLPVRMVSSLYVPPLGKDIPVEYVYRDFREVAGVKWPFVEEGRAPDVDFKQAIVWQRIEVNPPIDDAAFSMERKSGR
ncbi:MAG TPA: hypothetical protein VHQ90_11180 [Thermoanaerobaculia bacterium]|nr:hypothetical protein [Thermoanaerobaculia bacterium]